MNLFSMMFQIVKLPLVIAKDVATVIPDASDGKIFSDTWDQCQRIDKEISR